MPEKAQRVLERVQSNGRHLLGLINDVLDLSKIEAGQLTLAIEEYSVADMVATVISATESLARAKNIELLSAVSPGLPLGRGDARRLAQVLLNLVGNAIKFTDEGKVVIRARQDGDRFKISVIDTGPGIAEADQAKIFEEFQQVDNTSTRKKGGTGLGLSISRKIVELHGGRIFVESAIGKGSNFKIVIPVNAAAVREAAE
jgi:signal transduction histidine kinase